MPKFINLTLINRIPIKINVNHIVTIQGDTENSTTITCVNGIELTVIGGANQIMKLFDL